MQESPQILVIRRHYLGDIVLLGSFLRNLRLHRPSALIRVLVEPAYAGVLALNPDVDEPLLLPEGVAAWPRFILELRRTRWTHVFNLENTEGTALITRLSGAPFRLGLHHGGFPLKFKSCYTHIEHDPNELHESRPITEYFLRALAPAGVPIATREVRLVPRDDDVAALKRIVGATGPILLVHPGSRSHWRLWPAERFAAVCDRAQEELGVQVVLVGGPGERALIESIRKFAHTHLLAFTDPFALTRFAALARLSSVLLCHDSGPMHVAAAVGTPVVALYGSQSSVLFPPAGSGHILLQPSLPCTECVAPAECVPLDSYHNQCVRRLTVEAVFAAVSRQFSRLKAPAS
jgi:ADP-heptose:LPS heptosyltransferase